MAICVVPKYNTFKKERKKEMSRIVDQEWSQLHKLFIMHFHSYTTPLFMLAAIFFSEVIRVSSKNHLF